MVTVGDMGKIALGGLFVILLFLALYNASTITDLKEEIMALHSQNDDTKSKYDVLTTRLESLAILEGSFNAFVPQIKEIKAMAAELQTRTKALEDDQKVNEILQQLDEAVITIAQLEEKVTENNLTELFLGFIETNKKIENILVRVSATEIQATDIEMAYKPADEVLVSYFDEGVTALNDTFHEEINTFREEINTFREEINTFRDEINTIHDEIDTFHEEINAIHDEIDTFHEEFETYQENSKTTADDSTDAALQDELHKQDPFRTGSNKVYESDDKADEDPHTNTNDLFSKNTGKKDTSADTKDAGHSNSKNDHKATFKIQGTDDDTFK